MKKEEENARPDNAKLVPEIKHFFKVFTCQTFYRWKEINKKKNNKFRILLSVGNCDFHFDCILFSSSMFWIGVEKREIDIELLKSYSNGELEGKKKKREKKEKLAQPLYFSSSSTLFIDVASNGALSLKRCIRCVMQD